MLLTCLGLIAFLAAPLSHFPARNGTERDFDLRFAQMSSKNGVAVLPMK
jgi:hypothetical protein